MALDDDDWLFVLSQSERAAILAALAHILRRNDDDAETDEVPAMHPHPLDADTIMALRETLSLAGPRLFAHFDVRWNRLFDSCVYPDAATAEANISAEEVVVVPVGARS